jgi:hypothetical protein
MSLADVEQDRTSQKAKTPVLSQVIPTGSKKTIQWLSSGWIALLFFVIATIAFTWPLAIQLNNTLPDWGDAADSTWRIGSMAHQLRHDPLHLYQTTAFYPLNNGLALDELLTGQGLLAAPIIWLTDNPALAYNILTFASYALSGFAMWRLVQHLTGSGAAGLVAGLIFAFSPWHYGQYAHLGLAAQQWMVFALYFLMRFMEATQPGAGRLLARRNLLNLALFSFFFALQALVAGYYAYFSAILIGFYLVYYFVFETGLLRSVWRSLRRKPGINFLPWQRLAQQVGLLAAAGLVILVTLLPFILPFKQAQEQYAFRRDLTEVSYWSAAPNSLLRTTTRSWMYKPIQRGIFNLKTSAERMLYPGVIAVLLALIGLVTLRKRRSNTEAEALVTGTERRLPFPKRRWLFATLALTGLVLSFGPHLNLEAYGLNPTDITLPYKWFYDLLPGFDALRVPQRFGQVFMLGLAVCAGYGVARLQRMGSKNWKPIKVVRFGLIVVILGLVTADYFAPDLPTQTTPLSEDTPALYRWLSEDETGKQIPKDALLLELPITNEKNPVNTSPIYLIYSLKHGRPMLNGSANIIPPGYDRLFYEMQSFPSPYSLDIIEGLGVQYVVVHTRGWINNNNLATLEQIARPEGRWELLKSFDAGDGFKDAIYRVKPQRQRFEKLAAVIPEGAEVLIGDHPNHRRLYTLALPRLLGGNRHYFAAYPTIYNKIAGNIRPAQPKQVYQYAIFYRADGAMAEQYGYSPADLILNDESYPVQVYRKL